MTTTVKISAHLANTKEVQVRVSGQLAATLQDGQSTDVYAYDDRVIEVKEVLKGEAPSSLQGAAATAKQFRFPLGASVRIAISGELAKVIARAEYATMPDQYQLQYVNAAGSAVEQWWEDSTLDAA